MSGFSPAQLRKLTGKLERGHVQTRTVDGKIIDYVEGWFALSEANAIFGFGGWDRETVHFERLFERTRGEMTTCAYSARVRIRVRAGDHEVLREGTGCGSASARNAADAHERAIKAAETDATKRALATFGNRFGLCLYDKEQNGVTAPASRNLEVLCPDGQVFASGLSPEGFCTALRKIIENASDSAEISAWKSQNAVQIARLRSVAPDLKTARGEHYADVLERLFDAMMADAPRGTDVASSSGSSASAPVFSVGGDRRGEPDAPRTEPSAPPENVRADGAMMAAAPERAGNTNLPSAAGRDVPCTVFRPAGQDGSGLFEHAPVSSTGMAPARLIEGRLEAIASDLAPSRIACGPRIDKAVLTYKTVRRQRDKAHLRHVATVPCLVCKSVPSHAHHLTFAQPRGLALKVSDEFVVPLCAVHHNEVHRAGAEHLWWKRNGIEPLPVARKLWFARGDAAGNSYERSTTE